MRELITTALELAGLLFLNAGACLFVASFSVPAALALCGLLLLGDSALIVALSKRPTK
jgi:hypothetical protein